MVKVWVESLNTSGVEEHHFTLYFYALLPLLNFSYFCFMKLNKRQLETINSYFRTCPVVNAYLFGSYVRGDADSQSDIDILVDLDYSQKIGLKFVQMKIDLEKLLNANIDLVSSNGLSEYIKPLVDSEKQLIYAR